MIDLGTIANIAAILTAVVAVFGYDSYRLDQCCKLRRLENYLKAEKEKNKDHGQRSLLHLMAEVGIDTGQFPKQTY